MNICIFSGNLTKEPDLKFTPQGVAICKIGLALNDGYGDKKTVSYINCVAFNKTAELIANYTNKGTKILIEARVQSGSYEKKNSGEKVYTTDFIINRVEFIGGKQEKKSESTDFPDDDIFQPVDSDDIPF